MTRSTTHFFANLRRLAGMAICAVSATGIHQPARGQLSLTQVFEPSPMIAQGHLEGGINGEGNLRPDGKSTLMLAVKSNDLKVIAYLLQHGVDPDAKDAAGKTALDLARHRPTHEAANALKAYVSEHPGYSDYYADKNPVLTVVSARAQSGSPGCAAAHSLVVSVTDQAGQPRPP